MCESVNNSSVCAFKRILTTRSWEWLTTVDLPKCHTVKHAGSWRVTTAGALQDKKESLASQLFCNSNSQLIPITNESPNTLFCKKCLFTFLTYPTINTLIPMKCREPSREFWERNPREQQDWLIHNLISLILNSSNLTLSIDIPLRGSLSKSLSHHTHIYEVVIWCLGSSSKMTNSFGWCNGLIVGSAKLKKTRLCLTLLEQESWRA